MHAVPRQGKIFSAVACVTASLFLLARCSSTSTSLTAPSTGKCQLGVTTSAASFSAAGGSASLTIATTRDCTWSVTTDASWVAISGPRTGQGESVVPYTVAPNPLPAARSAALLVGNQRTGITQAGAPCRFDLSRTSDHVGPDGGRLSVAVTTLTGCAWRADSTVSWIAVASGQNGTASGTVELTVAANTGAARVGVVSIAGQSYTVSQDAAGSPEPAPTPPPTSPAPAPSPAPPPPGTAVELEGTISDLSGACPFVTFELSGTTVHADLATKYKQGHCLDLAIGDLVKVEGTTLDGGGVHATEITIESEEGDDDEP